VSSACFAQERILLLVLLPEETLSYLSRQWQAEMNYDCCQNPTKAGLRAAPDLTAVYLRNCLEQSSSR
jgi:hypothetical protein